MPYFTYDHRISGVTPNALNILPTTIIMNNITDAM